MARKSHDLFEVLGAHLGRQPNRAATKSKGRARDREVATPMEIGRGLGSWFQAVVGGPATKKKGKPAKPAQPPATAAGRPLSFGGAFLGVAVLISLSAGFLAGHWTGAAASPEAGANPTGQVPGPLNTTRRAPGAIRQLTPEEELERLHDHAYRIFPYPQQQRDQASRLVHWLREQGLEKSRMYEMIRRDNQQKIWVVACYIPAPDDRRAYEQLMQLQSPSFEPKLAEQLKKLKPTPVRVAR